MNVTIHLKYPFNASLVQLEELASIWNIQILKASTRSRIVKARMPEETYKRMFMENPTVGEKVMPDVLATFIEKWFVEKDK